MKLTWSMQALADLNRFAVFLQDRHPALARRIGREILRRAEIIGDYPELGRPIRSSAFRELSLAVMGATYILRYAYDDNGVVILRVFHSREQRET
ncbi:MAG TPA: type II toxin-antitoxin system RelE/ParE family toxin [Rhodopseudomonas sp.]|uniref:type II toxin-antitoxin system RelE/ParE family toxin n=1 Tax=Rhodopseudomonas sp. TaxID=1078 RepID=UPI002ED7CA4E